MQHLADVVRTYVWVQWHRVRRGLLPILRIPADDVTISFGLNAETRGSTCPIARALDARTVGGLTWWDKDGQQRKTPKFVARVIARYDRLRTRREFHEGTLV